MKIGTAIGPYQIIAKLGEGGMGEVYRADTDRSGMSTKRIRTILVLLAAIPLLAAALGANQNPRVIPPDAVYRGLTYGEWAAEWWQAVFAAPVEGGVHPLFTGGAVEGEEGIVFLASPVLPAGSPIS